MIRNKNLFKFWSYLNRLSNYGLNFGVASGYADYSGELYIIKKINANAPKEPVIFDVGANIGDWSKFLLATFKKDTFFLHLFEPLTDSFKVLNKNLGKASHFCFNNIALGNENGLTTLSFDTNTQGSAGAFIEGAHSEIVNTITLDTYCKEKAIHSIYFLKMDVQGFEYQILQGAKGLLEKKAISYIQFEIDEPCIENRVFFKDFWKLLSKNYKIYHSLFNGLVEIEKYGAHLENFRCMNYVAILKENK